MNTITGNIKAWLPSHSRLTPQQLQQGGVELMGELSYVQHDMTVSGWTLIGTAEITLHITNTDSIIENKVKALREEVASVRAKSTVSIMRLENQISQLLAIDFVPSEVATA